MADDNKSIKIDEKEVLLTEEEYAKKSRQKTKDSMNRVLRVVGLVASFLLIYAGLFDPIFELSYFGLLFDGESHNLIWTAMMEFKIHDDPLLFHDWLPKVMFTIVLIAAVIGSIYLLVYNIIDIVNLIKSLFTSTADTTKDLAGTVKDTFIEDFGEHKGRTIQK